MTKTIQWVSKLTALGLLTMAMAAGGSLSQQQVEEFLREAEVVETTQLSIGITKPKRLTLTDGQVTHDAHLQTVDVRVPVLQTEQGAVYDFRDSYRYNIAAYRLAKMLGLDMVPASVERKVQGKTGAVTWWIDDVLVMEEERVAQNLEPPDLAAWNEQICRARIFQELIYEADPNPRNLLIDKNWKVWLVDFTRAFRTYKKIRSTDNLIDIERQTYDALVGALVGLDEQTLLQELRPYLRKSEIRGILARRDIIVEHFQERFRDQQEVAVRGEIPQR